MAGTLITELTRPVDAFAWLAWLQDEPGAAAVQHRLDEAERGYAECVTSIINLGEAY